MTFRFYSGALLLGVVLSCASTCKEQRISNKPDADSPISIVIPEPSNSVSRVQFDEEQRCYVNTGNAFALQCLQWLYSQSANSFAFSPLSLQYALAMTMNGASGETAFEISRALGFGEDIHGLNNYMFAMMEQLPMVDTTVRLKIVNAMLVNKKYKVQTSYSSILNNLYYAPIEYVDGSNRQKVVNRINEWASHNTDGFVDHFIDLDDISPDYVASVLNTLYFKAQWAESTWGPIFNPEHTNIGQPFYLDNGRAVTADYMVASSFDIRYTKRGYYQVVEIPYASNKFAFYILLPDVKDRTGLEDTLKNLSVDEWNDVVQALRTGPEVHLYIPRFDIEKKINLTAMLSGLGIKRAFSPNEAQFNGLFVGREHLWLNAVLQKSKISVSEWGTEAASVTVNDWVSDAGIKHDEVFFRADHPFVFLIDELSSGVILFGGVFSGTE